MEDRNDDIIELNVGGQIMTTKRSTLCQVDGSLLAAMFSGRREDSMSRDKDGRIFLDFNPTHFGFILDSLRVKRISSPTSPAKLPKVDSSQRENFNKLVEYLGLSNEMFPQISEVFKEHSQGIELKENGVVAVFSSPGRRNYNDRRTGFEFVLGQNIYHDGIVRLRLSIDIRFQDLADELMLGVVPSDVTLEQISASCDDQILFYGWTIVWGGPRQSVVSFCSHIQGPRSHLFKVSMSCSVELEIILDCNRTAATLFLRLKGGNQNSIKIPRCNSWRFLVKGRWDHRDHQSTVARVRIARLNA